MSDIKKPKGESILIKVTPEVGAAIDKAWGGKTKGGRGNRGGRSWWILSLIHERLGFGSPEINSSNDGDLDFDLSGVDLTRLDRKSQVIATCWSNGLSLDGIVAFLVNNKVPTSRGGMWSRSRVKSMLERAIRKAKSKDEGAEENAT